MLLAHTTRGVNIDWLHPSIQTLRQGVFLLPWTSYQEPMDRLVKYCRVSDFVMTSEQIHADIECIARMHRTYEERMRKVFQIMLEVRRAQFL
jgi:hypothetical protein